ncbi:MAG TPA: hypothetical protein VGG38_07175 [Acidimicrobiales bacterium]
MTATIYAQTPPTYSLTVSPTTISFCSAGTPLTYPNGLCTYGNLPNSGPVTDGVTITNTGTAGDIDVNGANAVPSDGVTADDWTLCNGTSASDDPSAVNCPGADNGNPGHPGSNQYALDTEANISGGTVPYPLSDSPTCDVAFSGLETCAATSEQSQEEALFLEGPSSTTDTSATFTTTITWTAGPS